MKPTLASKYNPVVRPFLHNGALPQLLYNSTKNRLHTYAVRNSMRNYKRNRVLRARPPQIHHSESSLPRKTRCVLSQLRSGHSSSLKSYEFRIGKISQWPSTQI